MAGTCNQLLLCIITSFVASVPSNYNFSPVAYPARILPFSQCGKKNPLQHEKLIASLTLIIDGVNSIPMSCKDIHDRIPSATSGHYTIKTKNFSTKQVYCDMEEKEAG